MEGWIDYVIPQLYWEKGNRFGDFATMVKWWSDNCFGKSLYIGQALYRSNTTKNGWKQPNELNEQLNYLRNNEKVSGFAFYSASSLGDLSAQQTIALRDRQLRTEAAIHDDRRTKIAAVPEIETKVAEPEEIAISEELIMADFQSSLERNPISGRTKLTLLNGPITCVRQNNGDRLLSWKTNSDTGAERYALISFRKTGNKRYFQTIREISSSSDFIISEKKWKEVKKMELILVCRDIETKTDRFSNFFRIKRTKIKLVDNLFKHS
jgi:ribosomal protein L44E